MKAYVEKARVERVFQTRTGGWGVQVVEVREVHGQVYSMPSTLWFKSRDVFNNAVHEHAEELEVGDLVNASGFVSAKVREHEGEFIPEVSLNSARIQSIIKAVAPGAESYGGGWG